MVNEQLKIRLWRGRRAGPALPPSAGGDDQRIGGKPRLQLRGDTVLEALADREQRYNGGNTDHYA